MKVQRTMKIIFFTPVLLFLGCHRLLNPVSPSAQPYSTNQGNDQKIVAELYTLQQDYLQKMSLLKAGAVEAKELQSTYRESIRSLLPDLGSAVSLEEVEQLDANTLLLDKDVLLPLDTFKGAMELLVLNALASGKDVAKLRHMIAKEAATAQDRAVYEASVSRWPVVNGKYRIPYMFTSNLDSSSTVFYKEKTREAMDIWETTSENRIEFVETDFDTIFSFAPKLEIILERSGPDYVLGSAHIGAYFYSEVNLFQSTIGDNTVLLISTALHELGHTLGFWHEHQRGDRNTFVEVNSRDSANYGLLQLYGKFDAWRVKTFTQADGTNMSIYVPPPVGEEGNILKTYAASPYDYLSIMHYGGLVAKINKQGYETGEQINHNYNLSYYDKQGVKFLYPPLP